MQLGRWSCAAAAAALGACSASAAETVRLQPSDDFNTIVARAAPGTEFVLADGVYRGWDVTPKDGQRFVAEGQGAILDGSLVLDDWHEREDYWVTDVPPARPNQGKVHDETAHWREQMFIDEERLQPVAELAELAPGRWFRDGTTAYIADDPRERLVELGHVSDAFDGPAQDVTIDGLTVRQYAPRAQFGAIEGADSAGWQVLNVVAENNQGRGLSVGLNMLVKGGRYNGNGQLGIGGTADNVVIDGVEIAYNNTAGFDYWWEAGGIKITDSDNRVVRNSHVHHNRGPGIWLDWDNRYADIAYNLIHHNIGQGIQYEASRIGTVRGNLVAHNGQDGYDVGYWRADILLQNTSEVLVQHNTVVVSNDEAIGIIMHERGGGKYGTHVATGNRIVDNEILFLSDDARVGVEANVDERLTFENTLFDRNHYVMRPAAAEDYRWTTGLSSPRYGAQVLTWDNLRTIGWETGGRITAVDDPAAFEPEYDALSAPGALEGVAGSLLSGVR